MIFLTVGTHEPFSRLIKAVDEWCDSQSTGDQVFAQIATTAENSYLPRNFQWVERLTPTEFSHHFGAASLIVSHAGMGTIISALQDGKPIVVMPRRGHLGETRNDHQYASAQKLSKHRNIYVAEDETELEIRISRALADLGDAPIPQAQKFADADFTSFLKEFILAPKE